MSLEVCFVKRCLTSGVHVQFKISLLCALFNSNSLNYSSSLQQSNLIFFDEPTTNHRRRTTNINELRCSFTPLPRPIAGEVAASTEKRKL